MKEAIELKRSRVTYFRKARLYYKRKGDFLKEAQKDELEREDIGYKAFKLMRGTAPYFQFKKHGVMAMLRQLGAPHVFMTLSCAEVNNTVYISQNNWYVQHKHCNFSGSLGRITRIYYQL